jgi:formylglycine-generating enzyme required for sulfatase activity
MLEIIRKSLLISVVAVSAAFVSGCVDCKCTCLFPDSGPCCTDTGNVLDVPVADTGRDVVVADIKIDVVDDIVADIAVDIIAADEGVPTDVVPLDVPVDPGSSDDGQVVEDIVNVDVIVDVVPDVNEIVEVCVDGDPCEDGDPCTTSDHCASGVCVPGVPLCSEFENCDAGVCLSKQVNVPAGTFYMGCNLGVTPSADCSPDEFPYHPVTTPAYKVDAIEVTNVAFSAFLNQFGNVCDGESCVWWTDTDIATGLTFDGTTWGVRTGREEYPVDNVSRQGAQAYCEWAGRGLCSEAQWEKAARGGCEFYGTTNCAADSYMFPWGNVSPNCYLVNWGECGAQIAPSGSRVPGASLYGVMDMSGNLWEWVADAVHNTYLDAPADGSVWGTPGADVAGVLRGGGYQAMYTRVITVSNRSGQPLARDRFVVRPGFRCCGTTAP